MSEGDGRIKYMESVSTKFLVYAVRLYVSCPLDSAEARVAAKIFSSPTATGSSAWINDEDFANLVTALGEIRKHSSILVESDLRSVRPRPDKPERELFLSSGDMTLSVERGSGLLGGEHFTATISIGDYFEIKMRIDDKFFTKSDEFLNFVRQMQRVVEAKVAAHIST